MFIINSLCHAQTVDTLKNLSDTATLVSLKYNTTGKWGYYTGHNYLGRQQFAEKYYVDGTVTILGVIAQLTGKVSQLSNDSSAFTIWSIGQNQLPNTQLNAQYVKNKTLDVSGQRFFTAFKKNTIVSDSFYIAYDLLDYSHHAFLDSIGLLYGKDGSRTNEDLLKFGRNALQVHSHGAPVWRDFYSQNFTPIATHFALYPVIQIAALNTLPGINTSLGVNTVPGVNTITGIASGWQEQAIKLYPNPATDWIFLEGIAPQSDITIIDALGNEYLLEVIGLENSKKIDISKLLKGQYILLIKQKNGGFGVPFIKQ
jgi:hypothetical protein